MFCSVSKKNSRLAHLQIRWEFARKLEKEDRPKSDGEIGYEKVPRSGLSEAFGVLLESSMQILSVAMLNTLFQINMFYKACLMCDFV